MKNPESKAKRSIQKTAIASAIAIAIGTTGLPGESFAETLSFNWTGTFTALDPGGQSLVNTSITGKSANRYQTPVSGTLTYDTETGTGTASLVPFQFFNGNPTLPSEVPGISIQAIGDGEGGPGTLMLANMLFNWNSNTGIPVSLVWDGQGMLDAISGGVSEGETVSNTGAIPASDGTYVGWYVPGTANGYLNLGPVPMATTSYNTTNAAGCYPGACSGVAISGTLPLMVDTVINGYDYDLTTPTYSDLANDGVGGSPMQDGPFKGYNVNLDITSMTVAEPPKPSISMLLPGGATYECGKTGGEDVSVSAVVTSLGDDEIDTIAWLMDGEPVASGESVEFFMPLGEHTVEAVLTTVLGETDSTTRNFTVEDTVRPELSVVFLDSRTGVEITSIEKNQEAEVSISASDVCDPSPTVGSATAGMRVADMKTVSAHSFKNGSNVSLSFEGSVDRISATASAEDASGNVVSKSTSITINP